MSRKKLIGFRTRICGKHLQYLAYVNILNPFSKLEDWHWT